MANIHVSMLQTMAVASLLAACSGNDPTSDQQSGLGIGHDAKVMTRNLYLGADLSPAIGAPNLPALIKGAGTILRQVTTTNFPVRAKGLAAEIRGAKPDLVALQECALWRTGPVNFAVLSSGPTATDVRYDFLQLLLDELNAGPDKYEAVAINPEFDFEAPADEDANPSTGPLGADLDGRLTMRDVILARVDSGVRVSQPEGGHFQHLLVLPVLTSPTLVTVPVTRGWVKVEARVRGGLPFRFVATHLEAFDSPVALGNGHIREAQAGELVGENGPATAERVVLAGDLNSGNASDNISGNDRLAYEALLDGGMVERSTNDPFSCCIDDPNLMTGTAAELDHRVDHIMTNAPDTVSLVESFVTGRTMHEGLWDSDHAGVFSRLRVH
jgi:endonuclease/exonuclease/phosphatase family metal-dependent hydrolase